MILKLIGFLIGGDILEQISHFLDFEHAIVFRQNMSQLF